MLPPAIDQYYQRRTRLTLYDRTQAGSGPGPSRQNQPDPDPAAFLWNPLFKRKRNLKKNSRKNKLSSSNSNSNKDEKEKNDNELTPEQLAAQQQWEQSYLLCMTFLTSIPAMYLPLADQCIYQVYPESNLLRARKRFPNQAWIKSCTARVMTGQTLVPGQFLMVKGRTRSSSVELKMGLTLRQWEAPPCPGCGDWQPAGTGTCELSTGKMSHDCISWMFPRNYDTVFNTPSAQPKYLAPLHSKSRPSAVISFKYEWISLNKIKLFLFNDTKLVKSTIHTLTVDHDYRYQPVRVYIDLTYATDQVTILRPALFVHSLKQACILKLQSLLPLDSALQYAATGKINLPKSLAWQVTFHKMDESNYPTMPRCMISPFSSLLPEYVMDPPGEEPFIDNRTSVSPKILQNERQAPPLHFYVGGDMSSAEKITAWRRQQTHKLTSDQFPDLFYHDNKINN